MTLQISLRPEIAAKLQEQAAAAGQDLQQFAVQTLEERAGGANGLSPAEQLRRFNEWAEHMQQLVAKNVPAGHFVDDSRESIYAGRGE